MTSLAKRKTAFQRQLLDWYDQQGRDLPWRRETSLYRTVVSEFMLQQTQVKTVLPYFERWMQAFPDFPSLAKASEQEVLKRWEGLGYYTRARNLRKLAQQIAALPEPPRQASQWLSLPGIGPYTSAAICSIVFDDPTAVVDGNVVRILSRLANDRSPYANSAEAAKAYQSLAGDLLNHERPGDHNQAMMELGATVCRKRSPLCLLCPVQSLCAAFQNGDPEELPRLAKRRYIEQTIDRAWIVGPQGVLLHRIPQAASRMKGLHEIPTLQQAKRKLSQSQSPILTRKRSITKYRITERFFAFHPDDLSALPSDCLWATPDDIEQLPFSGPHRRWIQELLNLAPQLGRQKEKRP